MYLEDKFADIKIIHEDGESFEVWWLHNESVLAVCHSLNNYPSTVVHTMSYKQCVVEISKLLAEGWSLEKCSPKFLHLWKSTDSLIN